MFKALLARAGPEAGGSRAGPAVLVTRVDQRSLDYQGHSNPAAP